MTAPARSQLTLALASQLGTILQSHGYRTDIGSLVLVGVQRANESDYQGVILTPGPEVPSEGSVPYGHSTIRYTVSAFLNWRDNQLPDIPESPTPPWAVIDAVADDIRKALEYEFCDFSTVFSSLSYVGFNPIYPEGGGDICGVDLHYSITTPRVDFIP